MKIDIRFIKHGSAEYKAEVALRYKVLREPLGLTFSLEDLAKEKSAVHFGAFRDDQLLGCLFLAEVDAQTLKMRQVAVDFTAQRMGVGRKLVDACEAYTVKQGYREIVLSARDTAIEFYLALDYKPLGDIFIEVGLPHLLMSKVFGSR